MLNLINTFQIGFVPTQNSLPQTEGHKIDFISYTA